MIVENSTTVLAAHLGEALLRQGWSLTTAESCTGGLVAATVTSIAGSSAWFERGFITYSNNAKQALLGVQADTLMSVGAVSEAVVQQMAEGALTHSQAQLAIGISGIAGPSGGSPTKPVGTVYFAWASTLAATVVRSEHLSGDRSAIRAQAVTIALQGAMDFLTSLN